MKPDIEALLPPTFYQASISLIHKKDQDPLDPSSYRPASLLNVDNKLLAKILATRLETVLPTIISQDKTGFIKNRQLFFNIKRLLNIIYSGDIKNSHSEVILSLDAKKAFDRKLSLLNPVKIWIWASIYIFGKTIIYSASGFSAN